MKYIIIAVIVLLVFIPVICQIYSTSCQIASVPSRVIKRTLETDNVIHNYEWFHDVYQQLLAKYEQIIQHNQLLLTETDKEEKRTLRIELAGIKQSCRNLSAQYNANSKKINRKIFKGKTVPATMNITLCN
jgi:hypothetical protein